MKFATLALTAALLATAAFAELASAQPLEPSADLYNQLSAFQTSMLPTLTAASRWADAKAAGLAEQPGELDSIESQLLDLQDQAAALDQLAQADGIDPHIQRAAQATHQEISTFLAAIRLTDIMWQTGTPDFASSIEADMHRFSSLGSVADTELQAYADAYNRTHVSAH